MAIWIFLSQNQRLVMTASIVCLHGGDEQSACRDCPEGEYRFEAAGFKEKTKLLNS